MTRDEMLRILIKADGSQAKAEIAGVRGELRRFEAESERQQRISELQEQVGGRLMAVGAGIGAAYGAAAYGAMRFEGQMRKVNSIAQIGEAELSRYSEQVRRLGSDRYITQGPAELASQMYQIQQAGFDGQTALELLRISAYGAAAGVTTLEGAQDGLTGVMAAFGQKTAPEAQHVMDLMFRTMDRGKVTLDELGQQVGSTAVAVAGAGGRMEDMFAAISTLTAVGISAGEANTAIERFYMTMMDPPDALRKELRALGYETGTAAIKALGLAGTVDALYRRAGGSSDALLQMGFDMRAFRTVMALTGPANERFIQDLASMENVAGATQAALDQMAQSAEFKWKHAKAAFESAAITLGDRLLPTMTKGIEAVTKLVDGFDRLPGPLKDLAAYGGLAGGALLLMVGAEMKLRAGFTRMKADLAIVAGEERALALSTKGATAAMLEQQVVAGRGGLTPGAVGLVGGAGRGGPRTQTAVSALRARKAAAAGQAAAGAAGAVRVGLEGLAAEGGAAGGAAGAGAAGVLETLAPTMVALLTTPGVVAGAGAAALFWYAHKEMVVKAYDELDRTLAGQTALEAAAGGKHLKTLFRGVEVDLAAAQRYEPTRRERRLRDWALEDSQNTRHGLWSENKRWSRDDVIRDAARRRPGETDEQIKERLAWLYSQMPETTQEKMTVDEEAARNYAARSAPGGPYEEEQRTAALRKREQDLAQAEGKGAMYGVSPWPATEGQAGYPGTPVQINIWANDPDRIGEIAQQHYDRRIEEDFGE